ncbi:MAG: histone deacetylase [Nitrospira sp.]|nr:histone deacetylase [Candidatus Manganitrophaceae bacterium]HIL34368.1 histone deacetylase [Candidatus Manganitrophaceae bacterium]
MKKTGYVTHPIFFQHDTGRGHPETARRLTAIEKHLFGQGAGESDDLKELRERLTRLSLSPHPELSRWITENHHPSYYRSLKDRVPEQGLVYLDPDTPYSPDSLVAAEMAVSGVLTAIDRVMDGSVVNAFCALRPPGHHAEQDRAMGFCLFNNIAVGARYLQLKYGLKRIFIIDWDVHHGNGTQNSFYSDPSVFYFSTHQYPFYPGTGSDQERGEEKGEGFTVNSPLASGAGDLEIHSAFEKKLFPAVKAFDPDFILISSGFDAHTDDPLSGLEVTEKGFAELTRGVKSLAEQNCHGRIVSCLEGGYHLHALAMSVQSHLEVLSREIP